MSRWIAVVGVVVLSAVGVVAGGPVESSSAATTGTLSLFKRVENLATGASEGDRGKWDVQAVHVGTGQTIRTNGLNGFQSRTVEAGTYVISEHPNGRTPPGYRFRDWNCGGTTYTDPEPTISLSAGQNLTCTVTNEAVQPTLTLRKVVDGGSAPASMWTLRAMDGPTSVGGTANTPAVTDQPVRLGTYRLVEEGPGAAQGYVASPWSCTWTDHLGGAGTLPVTGDGRVTISLGQAVTCTITNTSDLPKLTLVKEIEGPDGTHPASDWTLSATPPSGSGISGPSGSPAVSHVSVTEGVGYALGESGPAGYSSSGWECVDVAGGSGFTFDGTTVALGADSDVVCTVTNTFTGGWLTLAKQVVDSSQPATDWTLHASGTSGEAAGTVVSGPTGSPEVTRVPVAAGDYDLSETGPGGYDTDGFVCDGGAPGTSVTVAPGDEVTCVITNVRPSTLTQLTLVKEVENLGGGPFARTAWGVSATGGSPPQRYAGITGLSTVTYRIVSPGHFVLGEEPLGTDPRYADYASEGWSCADTVTGELPVTGAAGNEVDIAQGMQVTCTVRNVWQGALVSFEKEVVGEPYASHEPAAWDLEIQDLDGSTVLAGDGGGGDSGIAERPIEPGTYRLVEGAGPDGYTGPSFRCVGDADGVPDDELVTVTASSVVSCVATNTAVPPLVTLVKDLDNTGGGTATVGDFTLMARGPGDAAISGASGTPGVTRVPLPAGEYVFSEDGPPGYDGGWDCVGATAWDDATEVATLGAGDEMVCTATNRVVRPTLTLVKEVDGGPATPADWTLTAEGPGGTLSGVTGDDAVTGASVDAGVYELGEAPSPGAGDRTAGYAASGWSCTAGELSGSRLTLAPGEDVTCTIVNAWQAGVLTLVKHVDGGTAAPGDWTLGADGPTDLSGTSGGPAVTRVPVPAGDYALSETPAAPGAPLDQYAPGGWSCTGGELTQATVTVAAGAEVTCEVTNTFAPPRLTLVKRVVGGPAQPASWTLTAEGPSTVTGTSGAPEVTAVALEPGDYALSEAPVPGAPTEGYTADGWSCEGAPLTAATVTLDLGDDVTCTLTNRHASPTAPTPGPTSDAGPGPTSDAGPDRAGPASGREPPGMAETGAALSGGIVATAGALVLLGGALVLLVRRVRGRDA